MGPMVHVLNKEATLYITTVYLPGIANIGYILGIVVYGSDGVYLL